VTDYLSSEATWRGQFWLPGQSGQEDLQGILTYKPDDGSTLSLIGGFNDGSTVSLPSGAVALREGRGLFPVVHGLAGGKPVTLLECRVTSSTSRGWFPRQVEEQDISVGHVLMGVLISDQDARAFSELTLELENLTSWDQRDDIMVQMRSDPDLPHGREWQVAVEPAESLIVTLNDLTIELGRSYTLPSGESQRHGLDVSTFATSYLTISSSEPKSIAEWDETAKVFQDLLTLAMDSPCAVLSETLTSSEALRNDQAALARENVVLYAQHVVVGDPGAESVPTRKALFTLGTQGVEFDTLIPRWLEVNTRFRVACDMILGLRYVKGDYLQTDLITAVGAAEALHDGLGFDPPMPKSEFEALKKRLLECVPEERKQWLREKLGHNTRTLRTKLLDLASTPDPEVMAELLPNPEAWAQATKKERDPVAHGGEEMSRDVELLNAITTVTTAVVLVNLLHQLNIPIDRMRFALVDNPTLASATRFARQHWPEE
jgi:hypothetical protein